MSEQRYAIKITNETEDTFTVAGHGVVFGGLDIEGEAFSNGTDYWLDRVPVKAVFYNHTLQEDEPIEIGNTIRETVDEIGILVEMEIQKAKKYGLVVYELLKRGVPLGISTGAVEHLVRKNRKSNTYKSWPIFEYSITSTPAEPRTVGLDRIKQLAETYGSLKTLLENDQEIVSAGVTAGDGDAKKEIKESVKMTEEVIQGAPLALTLEQITGALKSEIAPLAQRLEALETQETEVPEVAVKVVEDGADRELNGNPYKTLGEFLQSVANGTDQRLRPLRSDVTGLGGYYDVTKAVPHEYIGDFGPAIKAPLGLQEGIPSAGGFLVGQDRQQGILSRVYAVGGLLQRANLLGLSANSNGMTINAEDENSRVTGSRRGGIQAYWAAEAEEKTKSKPKWRQLEMKLKKIIALAYATDELLEDTSALESWIMANLPEEISVIAENAMFRGTGVGQMLGILNSGATVSVAKESGQAAATIVAANIDKMWSRRWVSGRNYVWLVNQDAGPQLSNLNRAVGTGGDLVYSPPGGISQAPYASLKGAPVLEVEYASTVGTVGDIMLVDLNQYQLIDKGGVQSDSSIHVQFTTDETVFRFVYRLDGMPLWSQPLTPMNGTNTVSPFVTLATRA